MTANPVLDLQGFGVAYAGRQVLRSVDLSIPAAGCTVLLGPSGTGKSTLLRTLAGFNQANPELRTWGQAIYAGAPCGQPHRPALVMQNSRLLVSNVLENLVCDLPRRATLTQRMQIAVLSPVLAECGQSGLLECLYEKVVQRPAVEQRIIAILRQALAEPALLMVDEPTAGLPPQQAAQILHVLQTLSRRLALLVVLHNLQEARQLASQVVLLAGGMVQESRPAGDFFQAPSSESGRLFLLSGSCPEPSLPQPEAPAQAPPEVQAPSEVQAAGRTSHSEDPDAGAPAVPVTPVTPVVSAACGPRGFVWLLPGRLAGTPWPGVVHGASYDLELLRSVGVNRLISLTEEGFDPVVAAPYGIECLPYPIPDMHPPTREQAIAICRRIDAMLDAGEVVAVHCRAGLGRTGTVLAAYWLWRGNGRIGAVRALEDVRRLEPGWVQSDSQVRFLEEFAQMLKHRAATPASTLPQQRRGAATT